MLEKNPSNFTLLSVCHPANISCMNLIALRKNPEFALRTSLSTMNVDRFIILIGKEENSPSSNEKYCWHTRVPRVIAVILCFYQTTKLDLIKFDASTARRKPHVSP